MKQRHKRKQETRYTRYNQEIRDTRYKTQDITDKKNSLIARTIFRIYIFYCMIFIPMSMPLFMTDVHVSEHQILFIFYIFFLLNKATIYIKLAVD